MPLSWMACKLGLAMINMPTKFEVSKFTNYEDTKGDAKCRNWGQSDARSQAMSPFDNAHTTPYSTLIEIMCLSCTVFQL